MLQLSAELEVFTVSLFECRAECGDLSAVLIFQSRDLGAERCDDVVVGRVVGGDRIWCRPLLASLVFDACSQPRVVVEERVGDAGFALDGLECHRFAAFDQTGDGGIGGSGLFFGFAAGRGLQNIDALLAGVVHETRLW